MNEIQRLSMSELNKFKKPSKIIDYQTALDKIKNQGVSSEKSKNFCYTIVKYFTFYLFIYRKLPYLESVIYQISYTIGGA